MNRLFRALTLISVAVTTTATLARADEPATAPPPAVVRSGEAVRFRTLDRLLRERAADAQTRERRAVLAALSR